ncbi:MAG: adenylosuccinate synthetase [Sulfolobales archaeon]|nr:adenylosuccinate synthetase [Sulfolobales archaeon]MDW8082905.1 adenylosuccinate synthetase [Sulfolobales archaeon]
MVGGFFGDEGKGKIVAYLSLRRDVKLAIRCGAINAGHTVVYMGKTWKLRSVPSAFVNPAVSLGIAAGGLIKTDVLLKEIEETGCGNRLCVDSRAGVIEDEHVARERSSTHLTSTVGSTLQGVGEAMVDRARRLLKLARDIPELEKYVCDLSELANEYIDRGFEVLIEGTQGTFLSLYHGTYPYVTSRDTTASAFLSEVGVGPKKVGDVIVVFKSYVTRVGSGPLDNEMSFEEASKLGWIEYGTVTGRPRRVAPFDFDLARKAVVLNSATAAAITKVDIIFPEVRGLRDPSKLPKSVVKWVEEIESALKIPVILLGTGEEVEDSIYLGGEK